MRNEPRTKMFTHTITRVVTTINEDYCPCTEKEFNHKFYNDKEEIFESDGYDISTNLEFLLKLANKKLDTNHTTFENLTFSSKYDNFKDALANLFSYICHCIGDVEYLYGSTIITDNENNRVCIEMSKSNFREHVKDVLNISADDIIGWEFDSDYVNFNDAIKDALIIPVRYNCVASRCY